MATAQDKFETLLVDEVTPWLRQRGFKRRDGNFRRRREEAWQIVNFQRDKYSRADLLRFTINLGVSLDVLNDDPSWRSRGWPLEPECDFRERIGLLHTGDDHWWRIRPLVPAGRTAKDVVSALEKALPWLDAYADTRVLLRTALRAPSRVNALGLASLVELAKTVGTEAEVAAAEAELRRWQRGERLAW